MPLGSLVSNLETKMAEAFKGAEVLTTSLPVGGTPPFPDGVLVTSDALFLVTSENDGISFVQS